MSATPDPLELIELQARALFHHDRAGRLTTINEPGGQPAPRIFLGRTAHGNIWRVRHDLPLDLVAELETVLAGEPVSTDLRQPPLSLKYLLDVLAKHAPIECVWQGPAWVVPESVMATAQREPVVIDDLERLSATFGGEVDSWTASAPCLAITEDGRPISVCFSARTSARAAEAGVETLLAFRRRGYAGAVTAAWAHRVRALGRIPLYSTSWDNHASQHVAQKLRLVLYGADLHIT